MPTRFFTGKLFRIALIGALLTFVAAPANAQTAAWKPHKNVEIVVGVSPGGGIDRTARLIQKITQTEEWKNEVARIGGVEHYLGSRGLADYLDAQHAQFRSILTELGLAKY